MRPFGQMRRSTRCDYLLTWNYAHMANRLFKTAGKTLRVGCKNGAVDVSPESIRRYDFGRSIPKESLIMLILFSTKSGGPRGAAQEAWGA